MNADPPAIVQPATVETEEEAFRREMRAFMREMRADVADLKVAVDYLVKTEALDHG